MATILFDLDGTLIDSTEAILESFYNSFETLGGKVPKVEEIKAQIGYPLADMYRNLGVDKSRVEIYVQKYKEHYREIHTIKTKLLPKAKDAIELASQFARLGVVTTKTGRYSCELLEHFNILNLFEVVVGSEDVLNHKPHPEPILTALKSMNIDNKKECWMIGDTCMDLQSASSAGVEGIGLLCGYGKEADLRKCSIYLEDNALRAVTYIQQKLKALQRTRHI